jgi:hypothetical protein
MRAFLKTLFGDPATIAVVVLVMALEFGLAEHHQIVAAALAVPFTVLVGVAWLAKY